MGRINENMTNWEVVFHTYRDPFINLAAAIVATAAYPWRMVATFATARGEMRAMLVRVFTKLVVTLWYATMYSTVRAIMLTPIFIIGPILRVTGPLQGAAMIGVLTGFVSGLLIAPNDPYGQLAIGLTFGTLSAGAVVGLVMWVTSSVDD